MCVHVCVSVCVCLCAWQRHFAEVLNVQKKAAEEVLSELEDHSHGETDEMSREEVEKAVGSYAMARQQDRMKL